MENPTNDAKPSVNSTNFRNIAIDHFGISANDNLVQLTLGLETLSENGQPCIAREVTAVLTPKSLKVLQILLTSVLERMESDLGEIIIDPQKIKDLSKVKRAGHTSP